MSRGETDIQSAASLFAFLYGASLVGAATGFAGRVRPAICDGGGEHQTAELGCSCQCSLTRTGCGSGVCCSCTAGSDTLPGRRGETFAAVSGELLLYLKPPKVKRDRFQAAPQNGRRRKAFSPFKGLHSVERKRKRNFLPTGEVRPSEHDTDF